MRYAVIKRILKESNLDISLSYANKYQTLSQLTNIKQLIAKIVTNMIILEFKELSHLNLINDDDIAIIILKKLNIISRQQYDIHNAKNILKDALIKFNHTAYNLVNNPFHIILQRFYCYELEMFSNITKNISEPLNNMFNINFLNKLDYLSQKAIREIYFF